MSVMRAGRTRYSTPKVVTSQDGDVASCPSTGVASTPRSDQRARDPVRHRRLHHLPRVAVQFTSDTAAGQIYVPLVNWLLLVVVMALVVGFGSSSALSPRSTHAQIRS